MLAAALSGPCLVGEGQVKFFNTRWHRLLICMGGMCSAGAENLFRTVINPENKEVVTVLP